MLQEIGDLTSSLPSIRRCLLLRRLWPAIPSSQATKTSAQSIVAGISSENLGLYHLKEEVLGNSLLQIWQHTSSILGLFIWECVLCHLSQSCWLQSLCISSMMMIRSQYTCI